MSTSFRRWHEKLVLLSSHKLCQCGGGNADDGEALYHALFHPQCNCSNQWLGIQLICQLLFCGWTFIVSATQRVRAGNWGWSWSWKQHLMLIVMQVRCPKVGRCCQRGGRPDRSVCGRGVRVKMATFIHFARPSLDRIRQRKSMQRTVN